LIGWGKRLNGESGRLAAIGKQNLSGWGKIASDPYLSGEK